MTDEPKILYRYTGKDGAHFAAVPARDLTARDVTNLTPAALRDVEAGTIYEKVKGVPKGKPAPELTIDAPPAEAVKE